MKDIVDLESLAEAIRGIGDQISTSINVGKVNRRLDGLSKENQLINWYFPRPINQRKASGTVVNKGYFIDRWKLVDGSVALTDEGLVLNGTIQQILEFPLNQPFVATVLTSDGIRDAEYDDTLQIFQITSEGETIIAAKLEIGTDQSLAYENDGKWYTTPPDLSEEMIRCYRYYYAPSTTYQSAGYLSGAAMGYNTVVQLKVPMRVIPKGSITGAKIRGITGYTKLTGDGADVGSNWTIQAYGTNAESCGVAILIPASLGDPNNTPLYSFLYNLILDAEL